MSVRYGNGNNMEMSCIVLKRNLLKRALNLRQRLEDNMYGDGDGPFRDYLPVDLWDEIKYRIDLVHRITNTADDNNELKNFFKSNCQVYMLVGYLGRRLKKLKAELNDGQVSFDFMEEERQQKAEKVKELEAILEMIKNPRNFFLE